MAEEQNVASNDTTGVGQQDPSDSNSDNDVNFFIIEQMLAQLERMKLCKVVAVKGGGGSVAAAGTVDVQLLVSLLDGGGNAIKQGVVYGLPWFRMQGGKNAVVIDPVVGDIGYVLCEDRDITNVKKAAAAGGDLQATPGSYRRQSISDGIYVGGVLAKDPPEQYLWLKPDGGFKLTDKFGNVVESTADGLTMTPASGKNVTVAGPLIVNGALQLSGTIQAVGGGTYAGNISTTGNVIANAGLSQVSLLLHQHSALNAPPTPGH